MAYRSSPTGDLRDQDVDFLLSAKQSVGRRSSREELKSFCTSEDYDYIQRYELRADGLSGFSKCLFYNNKDSFKARRLIDAVKR
jgi:hypothetical protein